MVDFDETPRSGLDLFIFPDGSGPQERRKSDKWCHFWVFF